MEIIPAIDIRDGRCVRLTQGDYDRETVYDDDPAAAARRWAEAGCARLHVVDLDGAREGRPVNAEAIARILDTVDVPVQVGGGLRTLDAVQRYLEAGVARAVLGTAAVKDRALLANCLAMHRERIVVGVDARDGVIVVEGWREASELAATELIRELADLGVPRVIYTDTLRDGTLTEPNFAALDGLLSDPSVAASGVRVVYSGGVASLEHLRRLAATAVEGAIVGRALYTGDIDLKEALTAVQA